MSTVEKVQKITTRKYIINNIKNIIQNILKYTIDYTKTIQDINNQ